MERLRPETHLCFPKEFNAMSLALTEVDKLANNIKVLYEADVMRAMEENRALAEMNSNLCRKIELLKSTTPERSHLPHQIDPEDAGVGNGHSQEIEKLQASHFLPTSKDDLRDTVVDGFKRDTVVDVFKPPLPPPLCSEPPAPPFSPTPPHIGSMGNAQFLSPEQLSKAESILVRDVWLEAQGVMIQTCQERLSFTVGRKHQQNAKLRRGKSLAMLARSATRSSCIMHPVGGHRMVWNFLCLLAILYDLFWIPLQVFDVEDLKFLEVCEWLLTIFWTTDVLMTFRTGYFVGSSVELRPRNIAWHYAKTWLAIDVIIVVLEWMGRFLNITSSASLLRSTRAARNVVSFVKLIRLAKMNQLWTAVQEQVNSNVFELSWTLIVLCLSMFAVVHVVACIWYALGTGSDDGWTTYDVSYEGNKNTFFWYIASTRWVISQLNGRTDMHPRRTMVERLFTCIMGIILALIAQALFISIITKTMIDLSELVSEKTRRRRLVNDYLEIHPLTPALTSQVKRCLYEYQDPSSVARTEETVLSVLPNFLQTNVLYQVRAPVVMQHSFFHTLRYESPWAMRLVCRRVIQLVPVSKCEVIFDKGDVCNRMLFSDGLSLAYGNPDNKHPDKAELGLSLSGLKRSKSRLSSTPKSAPIETTTVLRINSRSMSTSTVNKNTPTSESASMSDLAFSWEARIVGAGEWVSEAALWTDWRNQGRLLAHGHGVMVGVQADELANSLMKHPDAFAMASMYAAKFVEHLRLQDKLSDIISFEVVTLAPVLLNVTVISATGLSSRQSRQSGRFDSVSTSTGVYCICKVAGLTGSSEARFTTSSVSDCRNPMWYHISCVNISRHQSLIFEVWNDDFIGVARLDPEDFLPSGFAGDKPLSVGDGLITIKIEVGEVTDVEKVES